MDQKVKKQILLVRGTGKTNMLDVNMVARIALREGFSELADYLPEHRTEYIHFLLTGKEKPNEEN